MQSFQGSELLRAAWQFKFLSILEHSSGKQLRKLHCFYSLQGLNITTWK